MVYQFSGFVGFARPQTKDREPPPLPRNRLVGWFAQPVVWMLHASQGMSLRCLFLVMAVTLGCARHEGVSSATAPSSDTTTSPDTADARFDPKSAQATAPPARIALLQKDVQVTLRDYRIEMPDTLSPAQVTFNVTNRSAHEHSFEIEGEGIERALDRPLRPGQSAKLLADLHAGTYKVYCPVADHEQRGMTRPLVVR